MRGRSGNEGENGVMGHKRLQGDHAEVTVITRGQEEVYNQEKIDAIKA